jgi:hypothetical protein
VRLDLDPVGPEPLRHPGQEPAGPPTTGGLVVDEQGAHLRG